MQTNIHYEVTDTYCGEANYSLVKRGKVECKENEDYSDLAAVRRVKKAIGWAGVRCKTMSYGDMIAIYPHHSAMVCFITFHPFGNASKGL